MDVKPVSTAYQAQAYEPVAKSGKKPVATKEPAKSTEQVELSESSKNLQKVKAAVAAAPDIRLPIVEAIKKRIANNDYPIPTHTDKALDNMIRMKIL